MFPIALVLNVPNWQRSEVSISSKPVFINNSIIIALLNPCSAMDERNHNTEVSQWGSKKMQRTWYPVKEEKLKNFRNYIQYRSGTKLQLSQGPGLYLLIFLPSCKVERWPIRDQFHLDQLTFIIYPDTGLGFRYCDQEIQKWRHHPYYHHQGTNNPSFLLEDGQRSKEDRVWSQADLVWILITPFIS